MSEVSLFELLKEGDIDNCYQFSDKASLGGKDLVEYLNTLLYYSVSIDWTSDIKDHPIIVINSIKNILSDNRNKPSKILLNYCLDILIKGTIRDDIKYIDEIKNEGIASTVFVGNLEDSLQSGDWDKAKILAAKIFLASDRSRAVIDTIADIGLQNIEHNGVFIFHLLRAFHFKQEKSQTWSYACCLIEILRSKPIPYPHTRKELKPNELFNQIIACRNPDLLVSYMAMFRIWDGDYVRQNSYNREISHWLSTKQSLLKKMKIKESKIGSDNDMDNNYIKITEKIISQRVSFGQILKKITILETIRYITKIRPDKNLYYYAGQLIS